VERPLITCLLLVAVTATMSGVCSAQDASCVANIGKIPSDQIRPKTAAKLGVEPQVFARLNTVVPRGQVLRFVTRLSTREYALLYESADRDKPDTHILVWADGRVVVRFAMRNLPLRYGFEDERDWLRGFTAFQYARLCAAVGQRLYINLEAGNRGGFFVAVLETRNGPVILPIGDVSQGRMVISRTEPNVAEVWSVSERDGTLCTGCPKRYTVTTLDLSSGTPVVKAKRTTKRISSGNDEFQNNPFLFADGSARSGSR
jgi:hypothetical protein